MHSSLSTRQLLLTVAAIALLFVAGAPFASAASVGADDQAAAVTIGDEQLANFPPFGSTLTCQGGKPKEVEIPGLGFFDAPSTGHVGSVVGRDIVTPAGQRGVALEVTQFADSGATEGLGKYAFTLDTARQARAGDSYVQVNADGTFTQVMRFHLKAQVDALGNETLYSRKAVEAAADLRTFPQDGATYYLLDPVDFVDAKGEVRLTVHEISATMTNTKVF